MRTEYVLQQAAAFVSWHRRRGGSWEEDFQVWSRSKDFAPHEARRIRMAAHAELFACGDVVATELDPDFPIRIVAR